MVNHYTNSLFYFMDIDIWYIFLPMTFNIKNLLKKVNLPKKKKKKKENKKKKKKRLGILNR